MAPLWDPAFMTLATPRLPNEIGIKFFIKLCMCACALVASYYLCIIIIQFELVEVTISATKAEKKKCPIYTLANRQKLCTGK